MDISNSVLCIVVAENQGIELEILIYNLMKCDVDFPIFSDAGQPES